MNYNKVPLSAGLTFVGVPIGTARDITLRALDVLASADVLAAEDTRSLRKLMDIHGVPLAGRRIMALHDHSNKGVVERLVAAAQEGKSVAYASEAGMPLIADPGFELSRAFVAADLPVTCAPGPSAVLTALAIGGLPTDAFTFVGFLPSAASARKAALAAVTSAPGTLVFYESPKRVAAMLRAAAEVLGPTRAAVVCRELTKRFEEVRRGTLQELSEVYGEKTPKGEIVVLVERAGSPTVNPADIENELRTALETMSVRDAADLVSGAHGLARRKVYQAALALDRND